MAELEIDSFVSKLKSLWASGVSASLHVETQGGKASVCLKADVGFLPPPVTAPLRRRHRGPAYSRRQARRRENINEERNVTKINDAEEVVNSNVTNTTEVTDEVAVTPADQQNVAELEVCKEQIEKMSTEIAELQREVDDKTETIAVNDMLHEDFKERIKDKYLYDSNDEMSDYHSDEETRHFVRQVFWKKKLKDRGLFRRDPKIMDRFACQTCDFVSKSEPGLKTHVRKKH